MMKLIKAATLPSILAGIFTLDASAFPIPLPSPVPANETPFANLQPGQYAILKNITTNAPSDVTKACSIRLSQKFDKSGQAAVIYVIKENTVTANAQWDWIDKYNIILVNLGLWDNQPFYTTGYDEADIMIDNGIIPMLQGARYLVEKYYNPDPEKFYVSGWSVGGDLFTAMSTRAEWRGVIKGVIGTPGATIASGNPATVPIAQRGWVKYFNGCGSLDGAQSYSDRTEQMRLAGVKANNTVLYGIGHSTGEPIREPGYLWFRGRGLNLEYWNGTDFNQLLSGANNSRQEATLNFSWATDVPYEYGTTLRRSANYSMRFTGFIQPRFTETYTFHATADDGVRVWVNGTQIIDQWAVQSAAVTHTGTIALIAGQPVAIKVEYFRATGPGTLKMEWSSTTQTKEVLPTLRTFYGAASTLPNAAPNSGTWRNNSAIAAWLDGNSWNSSATAFGTGSTASFTNDIPASQTISINGDVTIGNILISDDGASPAVRTFSTSEDGLLNLQPASGGFSTVSVREGETIINVPLYGSQGLNKSGSGSLRINGDSIYPGTTRVEGGSLRVAGKFTSQSIDLVNNSTFEINHAAALNYYAPNAAKTVLTGTGTFRKSGAGTLQLSFGTPTAGSGQGCIISLKAGSLIDVTGGKMTNGIYANSNWVDNFASLNLATGTTFDVWNGAPIRIDALNGTGTITNGLKGGVTSLTLGVANGSGSFSGPLSAVGLTVAKTGTGTQTLTSSGISVAATTVNNGKLVLDGSGTNALGNVTASATGQLRLTKQINVNSATTATSGYTAGTVVANSNAVIDITTTPAGSTVAYNNPFWRQSRSWPVLAASSITGAFSLGTVSNDPGGRSAANFGNFSLQSTSSAVTLNWSPLPFIVWQDEKFGVNATNAAIAGPAADPDKDSISNLIEYATGLNPLSSDVNRLPVGAISGGYLTLTYTRLKQATDVTVAPEASSNLESSWTSAGITVISQVDNGSTLTTTVRDAVPRSGSAKRFMRLKVTKL